MRSATRVAAAVALLLVAAGCASVPAYRPAGPRPTPAATPTKSATTPSAPATTTPASGGTTAAAPDTVPSRDAEAVLATIPEPLPPEQRSEPPATLPGASDTAIAGADTAAAESGAAADIPVPAPTPVLGQRPLPDVVPAAADSAPAAPPAAAPSQSSAPPPAAAAPDTCWRVQIGAPAERARAEGLSKAGESQLQVPFVIEQDHGLYKVRTRGCLDGNAADVLRARARDAGFGGAFRFAGRKP